MTSDGTFFPMVVDIKFGTIRVRMLPFRLFYRRPNLDGGSLRVFVKRGNLGQRAPQNFLRLGSRLEGEIHLQISTISKEE